MVVLLDSLRLLVILLGLFRQGTAPLRKTPAYCMLDSQLRAVGQHREQCCQVQFAREGVAQMTALAQSVNFGNQVAKLVH